MSSQIPTHYVTKFTSGIRILQQQQAPRFRGAVDVDTAPEIEGKRAMYDQLDSTSMVPVTDRHGKTQVTDDVHARRVVTFKPAEKASMVDRADLRRVTNDPRNAYARSHIMAAGRYLDDQIIPAFFATAVTGEEGVGTAVFDSTDFEVAAVSGGLTLEQLLDARQKLEEAENEEEGEDFQWHIALTARQRNDLLRTTEVTSSDYNTVRTLVSGQIDTFLGLMFHKSQRLEQVSNDIYVPVWVQSSMKAAISQDVQTFMDIIPERRHSVQIRTEIDVGATRMDEKGVVRILADVT